MIANIFALVTLALTVSALPGGAPKCKINPMIITNGHGVAATALGYTFDPKLTTYTPGGPAMALTIMGGQAFKGILAYVTTGAVQDSTLAPNGVNNHVGVFALTNGLRAQTNASCAANTVINDAPASTVTQAMPLNAQTPFTLMWTPPATNVGVVTLNAVISTGTKRTPWDVVKSIQLMPAGGAPAANPATPATPANPPVAKPANPPAASPATPPANAGTGNANNGNNGNGNGAAAAGQTVTVTVTNTVTVTAGTAAATGAGAVAGGMNAANNNNAQATPATKAMKTKTKKPKTTAAPVAAPAANLDADGDMD
ncbi:hypothetical protein HDU76_001604 [Blyttiomyces sp. JEL0837]|nr:hypothetical protein HDU76_001604 [Blyttiomyces sp. JEL0837]